MLGSQMELAFTKVFKQQEDPAITDVKTNIEAITSVINELTEGLYYADGQQYYKDKAKIGKLTEELVKLNARLIKLEDKQEADKLETRGESS